MRKLSIIIPVYFNEDTLEDCYNDLHKEVLVKLDDYEVVIVNDGSADNSYAVMQKIAERDSRVKLVNLSRNFGSHAACLAGFVHCSGDCATIKAADLQEPSALILDMYEKWKTGSRVVLAVRSDRKESFSQKMFANFYYALLRKFVNPIMPKGGFDCYLIDRRVIETLKLLDERNSAITLQILWTGFKIDTVYYTRLAREKGVSRWTLAKKIKLVVDSVIGFSYVPVRIMTVFGTLFFFGSIAYGLILLIKNITRPIEVQGWMTLMLIMLFSFGLIMLSLGILGEYVWRILDAARNRPVYIVDEKEAKKNDENAG